MKHGKKYLEAEKKLDRTKAYALDEGLALVKDMSYVKFDESVEICVSLSIKKSHSIRETFVMPHQFTGEKKILVFAKGEKADEAKAAGATYVGDMDLVEKVKGGWLDFDICIATPDMMKDVGRLGQVLGRRGLMPNPRTKTVTNDLKEAVAELKRGRVEFRADKGGVVHLAVGKLSMDPAKVAENARFFISELLRKKPADLKGEFVKSIFISSTMGPGVRLEQAPLMG